jgi:hypothetical protein
MSPQWKTLALEPGKARAQRKRPRRVRVGRGQSNEGTHLDCGGDARSGTLGGIGPGCKEIGRAHRVVLLAGAAGGRWLTGLVFALTGDGRGRVRTGRGDSPGSLRYVGTITGSGPAAALPRRRWLRE